METTVNSSSRSSASYLKELDIAKAIGIILVVYGHFYIEFTSKSAPEFAVARVIYLFHMPLFFALTGLTNGIYGKRAASHFKSDLKKLFVPYIIWSFIYLLAIILVRGVIPGKMDKLPGILSERFLAFVTGRGIAPIWFLLALFLGRTVYDLIRRAISFDKRKNRVLVLLALGAISLVSIAIFKKLSAMLPGTENTVYRYLLITFFRIPLTVFFLIEGECIGRNWAWFKKLKNAGRLFMAIMCGVILAVSEILFHAKFNFHTLDIPSTPLFLLTGTVGTLMVLMISLIVAEFEWAKVIEPIGRRSFDIMLLHYPPMPFMTVLILAEKSFHLPRPYIINTAITILLCMFISKYILEIFRKRS
nr:acyltransferase family protein [uncultured Butyrivibrio sp.]